MAIDKDSLITLFRNRGRGDPPAALADVFINALLRVGIFLDAKNTFARDEQSLTSILVTLQDIDALSILGVDLNEPFGDLVAQLQSDIDKIGTNFGKSRQAATQSRGNVLLFRNFALDEEITIPAGRKFFATEIEQEYQSTETVVITAMSFDITVNAFVASIPVESVDAGIDTIAAENQINQIRDPIPGIDGVVNVDVVGGGRDRESDQRYAERLLDVLSANNIGTKSGYAADTIELENVNGVSVVGANDPFMFRDLTDGGSVDILVTDPFPVSVTELVTASQVTAGPTFVFRPSRQPIINDIATINPPAGAVLGINKDLGAFGGSLLANDEIVLDTDPPGLVIGYQINRLIADVQEFWDTDERNILGSNILVREAFTVGVDVIMTIRVNSGFSTNVVRSNVESEITKFIAALNIGQDLEQSDVIQVATNVAGVDRVNIPLTKFDRTTGTVQNVIVAASNEVLRPNSIIVNV